MDVDFNVDMKDDNKDKDNSSARTKKKMAMTEIAMPIPELGSISVLREKLHARMAALRRGGTGPYSSIQASF
jgi:hypothetical protein